MYAAVPRRRQSTPTPGPDALGGRVKASPLARRIAGESGVDLHGLTGSGPGGRIVKADVLAPGAAAARRRATPAQLAGSPRRRRPLQ